LQTANDEVAQLRTVVQLLRNDADGMKIKHEEQLQNLERARRAEFLELQQTIAALRVELEKHGGR
jgi:hypothetical protein